YPSQGLTLLNAASDSGASRRDHSDASTRYDRFQVRVQLRSLIDYRVYWGNVQVEQRLLHIFDLRRHLLDFLLKDILIDLSWAVPGGVVGIPERYHLVFAVDLNDLFFRVNHIGGRIQSLINLEEVVVPWRDVATDSGPLQPLLGELHPAFDALSH